jgi:hypothetical protein
MGMIEQAIAYDWDPNPATPLVLTNWPTHPRSGSSTWVASTTGALSVTTAGQPGTALPQLAVGTPARRTSVTLPSTGTFRSF